MVIVNDFVFPAHPKPEVTKFPIGRLMKAAVVSIILITVLVFVSMISILPSKLLTEYNLEPSALIDNIDGNCDVAIVPVTASVAVLMMKIECVSGLDT